MPAAEPTKQRYIAGGCLLEVEVQPSALSQWSDRLVTNSVTFRLWLSDDAAMSYRDSSHADERQASQRLVAEGDRTLLQSIAQYIQTQTRQTLAVAALGGLTRNESLSAETFTYPSGFNYSQPLSYLQLCDLNTVLSQYEQAILTLPSLLAEELTEQLSENVILLPTIRDRQTDPSTNVVRLPRRRRNRVDRWASSAAAALAAVGLTTALWYRQSNLQDLTVANEVATSARVSESETAQSLEPTLEEDTSADETQSADTQSASIETADTGITDTESSVPNLSSDRLSTQATEPLPRTPARPTRDPRDPVAQATEPAPPSSTQNPTQTTTSAPSPAISEADTEPLFAEQSEAAPEADELEADDLKISELELDTSGTDEVTPQADVEIAESESLSHSEMSSAPARSAVASAPSAAPPAAFIPQTTSTVGQVQTYFQQRWQGGGEAALLYDLKLSATGEVVSFTAINEAAARQRDRLFPSAAPPSFLTNADDSSSTLRVVLNSDGTVQVIETQ
ncbi:hypothetical protein [cf. Phormidesmis sp. LEGE 11477]|uniref:hypothetical protein n=1 Tax=cf. Phormidesmis sp. LEGE 11477 TaxID=1828680 RepID=UPI0018828E97|nr:hypothetical protein [cf. Phormidesmis sp. LEGE 11477]